MEFYTEYAGLTTKKYAISCDKDFKNIIAYFECYSSNVFSKDDVDKSFNTRLIYGNSDFDEDIRNIISLTRFVINSFKEDIQRSRYFSMEKSEVDLKYASIDEYGHPLPTASVSNRYLQKWSFNIEKDNVYVRLCNRETNIDLVGYYFIYTKEYSFEEQTSDKRIELTDNGTKEELRQILDDLYQVRIEIRNIFDTSR